jgi:hypothetical protein
MGMNEVVQQQMVIVLLILVEVGTPIPCEMVAAISEQEEYEVRRILEEKWREFLQKQMVEEELCYSIYHASFLDFLKTKWELKPTRKLFQDVNQLIVDYIANKMTGSEETRGLKK